MTAYRKRFLVAILSVQYTPTLGIGLNVQAPTETSAQPESELLTARYSVLASPSSFIGLDLGDAAGARYCR